MLCRYLNLRYFSTCLNSKNTHQSKMQYIMKSKLDLNLKCRENPLIFKLESQEFNLIISQQEVRVLKNLFDRYNYDIRIAGGAVRDLLMGQPAMDLDFATTATPAEMKEMFHKENIRLVNLGGEKHGTVTPRINDKKNFEITTLRIDKVTDGRHAEVVFTTDWKLDANRRDLTINSMFLGFEGSVYDYFYGYDDLLKRRVAFVGDPDIRIKEDYLRILRYFRFYGRVAEKPDDHEVETLDVIRKNTDGLLIVSGERVLTELRKILKGNFAAELLKRMLEVGVGKYTGFPQHPNIDELDIVLERGKHLGLHYMCYIAALLSNPEQVLDLHSRLKFTNYERDLALFIVVHRNVKTDSRQLLPYEKLVLKSKLKLSDVIQYVEELLKYKGEATLLEEFRQWKMPKFPINRKILTENGVEAGKKMNFIINKLKDVWLESDFNCSQEELVKMLPHLLNEYSTKKSK